MDNDTRIRPLCIARILYERTDEDHYLTTNQLIDILKTAYHIGAHRQTIAEEIRNLKKAGMDIDVRKSTQNRMRVVNRKFSQEELKLLISAIQSSTYLSSKQITSLTEKLGSLASKYKARDLKQNIIMARKNMNSSKGIHLFLDAMNTAINKKRKVSFCYFYYNERKGKKLKNNGNAYIVSPYHLIWTGEYYYMVGWSDKHEAVTAFRIDRIPHVPEILDEPYVKKPEGFDINNYIDGAFPACDCEKRTVTLRCENCMMDAVIDRFGKSVKVAGRDAETFEITETVAVGNAFYSWVFGFGGRIVITKPDNIRETYQKMLEMQYRSMIDT